MNLKTIIAAAFLVASILIFTSNEAEAVAASNFETASSRKLYVQHCASCHGVNGKSQTPEGRELMADDLTTADVKNAGNAKLIRIISNGKAEMPGFKKKLSAAQIASVAKYIKSL